MPAAAKVAFSIEPVLLRQVDSEARRRRVSRSRFIRDAIDAALGQAREHDIAERIDAVFADPAAQADQRNTADRLLKASPLKEGTGW